MTPMDIQIIISQRIFHQSIQRSMLETYRAILLVAIFMTIEEQIKILFENFGPIVDIKLQTEKGFGFIKYLSINIE